MKFTYNLMLVFALAISGMCMAQESEPVMIDMIANDMIANDIPGGIIEDILLATPDKGLLASNELRAKAQVDPTPNPSPSPDPEPGDPFDLWVWLSSFLAGLVPENVIGYFGAFLLIGETVVRLTPTEEDDKWFLWVKRIIDTIFPSRKRGGGTFPKAEKTPI